MAGFVNQKTVITSATKRRTKLQAKKNVTNVHLFLLPFIPQCNSNSKYRNTIDIEIILVHR